MQIFLNNSILPSVFFDVRVPVHACMMTGEKQISLGLTRFQFAFALLLPSPHTLLGLTRFQFAFALLLPSSHTLLGLTRFQFVFALLLLSSHTLLGLTRFQFVFALLLPSSHTLLGLCGMNCLRSQIEQINHIYFFGQPYSEADRAL